MLNNLRFATAIHILTLLDVEPQDWLSSEYIAGSIQVHPVVVRKEIKSLKKAALVQSKEGKGGGSKLAKASTQITLADIYASTLNQDTQAKLNATNPACAIGKQVNIHILNLYTDLDQHTKAYLNKITLNNFITQFKIK